MTDLEIPNGRAKHAENRKKSRKRAEK